MPVPKSDKSLLTATEKERLNDAKLDPVIRKRNDMIVRNKILSWLNNADDVLFALEHLPTRKLRKELEDNYIYRLLEIVRELLDLKDFRRLFDIGDKILAVKAITEHHNPNFHLDAHTRIAIDLDFDRIFKLENALDEIKVLTPDFDAIPAYEQYKEEQLDKFNQMLSNSDAKFLRRKGDYILFGTPRRLYPDSSTRIEKSIKYFDKALDLDQTYREAWHDKAYALGELGRYKEALVCINKVLDIDPNDLDAWTLRAIYNKIIENYEESLKCVDKVIEINPLNKPMIIMKIDILKDLGKDEDAQELIFRHFREDKRLKKLKGW